MKHKICLTFAPFSSFSYVPSGILGLKSYIEKNMEDTEVSAIDLNNYFYTQCIDNKSIKIGMICSICPSKRKGCREILNNPSRFYRKLDACIRIRDILKNSGDLFTKNAGAYNRLLLIFNGFFEQSRKCIDAQIERFFLNPRGTIDIFKDIFAEEIKLILAKEPSLIGFSVFCKEQFNLSLLLAKLIKDKTNIPIVFGGAYISILDGAGLLKNFDFIDFIIFNEGELGIVELIRGLNKKDFTNVPNLIYRKNSNIVRNEEKSIENLDDLPALDFQHINLDGYFSSFSVINIGFSRGCCWKKCSFCALHRTYGQNYRVKSTGYFLKEIKKYYNRGIRHFIFNDEVIPAKKIHELSRGILENKLDIYYGFMARPTNDFSCDILSNLYLSGCRYIFWGVESGSQKVLDMINKGTVVKDISILLKSSYKVGIANIAGIMSGLPCQTKKDIMLNRKFLLKNNRNVYAYSVPNFGLVRNSEMASVPDKFAITGLKNKILLNLKDRNKFYDFLLSFSYKNRYAQEDIEIIRGSLNIMHSVIKKHFEHLLVQLTYRTLS